MKHINFKMAFNLGLALVLSSLTLHVNAASCTTGAVGDSAPSTCEANGLTWSLMTIKPSSDDLFPQFNDLKSYLDCSIGEKSGCSNITGKRLPNQRELFRQFQFTDLTQENALKYSEMKAWLTKVKFNTNQLGDEQYQNIDMLKHDPYLITSTLMNLNRRDDGNYQIKAMRLRTGQLINMAPDLNFCHVITKQGVCNASDSKNQRDPYTQPIIVLMVGA